MNDAPLFDSFADSYDEDLNQALALTGEDKDYYSQGRVQWMVRRLKRLDFAPNSILDYGCGIGDTTALLKQAFGAQSAVGVDISERSLQIARTRNENSGCEFRSFSEHPPDQTFDLAYCNGVFHHIPPTSREAAAQYVFRCLRPGGLFAFWENNPWNPGTRYVMSKIPFDRDAVKLSSSTAKRLLRNAGFEVLQTDYRFFFPRSLRALRLSEPWIAGIAFGAQYQVLARKP
jgi:SAM-dependent methyltransferase